jgi:transcriptional regulator with XRE-family HTH domain
MDATEVPFLEGLGVRIAELPAAIGVSQATLAERAELARTTVERIEGGTRRTRRSTLERIAEALDRSDATEELVALVGPALAPESAYARPHRATSRSA